MKYLQIRLFLFSMLAIYSSASGQWVKTGNVGDPDMPVYSFAAHNGNLFAGTYEGVYYTSDEGSNWIYTGLTHSNIYSLLSFGKYLFAGIARYGDTDSLSGIFVSTDNGESWKSASTGLMQRDTIYTLCQLNTSLYVGTLHGIFRSDDSGKNWVASGLQDRAVHALAHDGKNLYAGTYFGVYRSSDFGTQWVHTDSSVEDHVRCLAIKDSVIFAGTFQGVYRSTDKGESWAHVNDGFPVRSVNTLLVHDTDVFASNPFGIFRSSDDGINWSKWSDESAKTIIIVDSNMYAGSTGVWRRSLSDLATLTVVPEAESSGSLMTFPNPFTQSTSIRFSSPDHNFTQVSIHNLLGSEVARLFSGSLDAGGHSFTWDAHGMPEGMYVCIVKSGGEMKEIPLMLVHE